MPTRSFAIIHSSRSDLVGKNVSSNPPALVGFSTWQPSVGCEPYPEKMMSTIALSLNRAKSSTNQRDYQLQWAARLGLFTMQFHLMRYAVGWQSN